MYTICYAQSMKVPISSRNIILFSYKIHLNRVVRYIAYILLCPIHEIAHFIKFVQNFAHFVDNGSIYNGFSLNDHNILICGSILKKFSPLF